MIQAIAIDDEPPALKVIENFCSQIPSIKLVKTFSKPNDALRHIQKFPVNLIFLDIQMPSVNGIEFSKQLNPEIMVIFTTAFSEYAVEGFNVSAVDYLLKPFTFERFQQAVQKANDYYAYLKNTDKGGQHLYIRADYSLHKIYIPDILFIEGLDDYLKIHLEGKKTIVARMTMKNLLEKLPSSEFIRVHRSFIVPFKRIESVRNKMIQLAGEEIPIGNSYEEQFFSVFKA